MTAKRISRAELIDSLGAFNPVGHIVLAFANDDAAAQAAEALRAAGFDAADVLVLSSSELEPGMTRMLRDASGAAGFGYEITLMRRYLDLANQGAGWLVVFAPEDELAERVREVARKRDARVAVRYHRLASEELIEPSRKREQL